RIKPRDLVGGSTLTSRCLLKLVLAEVGVGGEMADIGDIDDVSDVEPFEPQRASEGVGEHIGAHVADVLEAINCRPAAVDSRGSWSNRSKILNGPRHTVKEPQGGRPMRRIGWHSTHPGVEVRSGHRQFRYRRRRSSVHSLSIACASGTSAPSPSTKPTS